MPAQHGTAAARRTDRAGLAHHPFRTPATASCGGRCPHGRATTWARAPIFRLHYLKEDIMSDKRESLNPETVGMGRRRFINTAALAGLTVGVAACNDKPAAAPAASGTPAPAPAPAAAHAGANAGVPGAVCAPAGRSADIVLIAGGSSFCKFDSCGPRARTRCGW